MLVYVKTRVWMAVYRYFATAAMYLTAGGRNLVWLQVKATHFSRKLQYKLRKNTGELKLCRYFDGEPFYS